MLPPIDRKLPGLAGQTRKPVELPARVQRMKQAAREDCVRERYPMKRAGREFRPSP